MSIFRENYYPFSIRAWVYCVVGFCSVLVPVLVIKALNA